MEYMTIKETAEKWNLSVRRVQTICNEGMIDGAMKFGNIYLPIIQLVRDKICNIKHRGMLLSWQLMITIEEIWKKTLTAYILRNQQIFW